MASCIGKIGTPTALINHSIPSSEMLDVANLVARIVYARGTDIDREKHAARMAQEFADYAARLLKEKKLSEIEAEGLSLRQAGVPLHLLAKYLSFYEHKICFYSNKSFQFQKIHRVNWETFAIHTRKQPRDDYEIDHRRRERFLIENS